MPALYSLAVQQLLPPETAIVGVARSELPDDEFRARMRAGVEAHGRFPVDDDVWDGFARRLRYMSVPFNEPAGFRRLKVLLEELDAERGTRGNRLFYLATAPDFFPVIAESLGSAGLAEEGDGDEPFARLVVEKPFGADLASARELNSRLNAAFRERQVYRIDHYLGKETVQNILVLRFGNAIFEPIWNRRYVDHVQITVAEELGVGTRGGYYDRSGALRDIVQNHMLQVLSIVAMEPPARFESRDVRDEKVKVLRAIPPFDAEDDRRRGARPVRPRVDRGRARAGLPRGGGRRPAVQHRDVRRHARHGGQLALVGHAVLPAHRQAPAPPGDRGGDPVQAGARTCPSPSTAVETVHPNLLVLRIQPDEGASLRFLAKVPGPQIDLREVSMDFSYGSSFLQGSPEAYERLLLDALLGDSTLFARWDEVERAWEILEGLIQAWAATPGPFPNYAAGTWGPRRPRT